jgi:hypothetical protein
LAALDEDDDADDADHEGSEAEQQEDAEPPSRTNWMVVDRRWRLATMPAKISIEMPLPMPRSDLLADPHQEARAGRERDDGHHAKLQPGSGTIAAPGARNSRGRR